MKKNYMLLGQQFLKLTFTLLMLFYFIGCTQNSSMPDDARRRITVYTMLLDEQGNKTDNPAKNTAIKAIDLSNGNTVAENNSGNDGMGVLEFDAPAVGNRYLIEGVYIDELGKKRLQSLEIYPCCKDDTITLYYPLVQQEFGCSTLKDSTFHVKLSNDNSDKIYKTTNDFYIESQHFSFRNSENGSIKITQITPSADIKPFEIAVLRPSQVNTGEFLEVEFRINSKNDTGAYKRTFIIKLECSNSAGTHVVFWTFELEAEIIDADCICISRLFDPNSGARIITTKIYKESLTNPVKKEILFPNEAIFKNEIEGCEMKIHSFEYYPDHKGEWSVLNWTKDSITTGESFYFDLSFNPQNAPSNSQIVKVNYFMVNEPDSICAFFVELKGKSCNDVCPTIDNKKLTSDTIKKDIIIRFSSEKCGTINTNENTFTLRLDDYACDNYLINIQVEDKEQSKLATEFYKLKTSSSINLNKGNSANITFQFTSPTVAEFMNMFDSGKRQKTGTAIDSIFTIYITISTNPDKCNKQVIKLSNRVWTEPIATKPNILYAYNQVSQKAYSPKKLVCWFNKVTGASTTDFIDKTPKGEYPPDAGDFYIDVDDTSSTFVKKEPYIKLCQQFDSQMDHIKYWSRMSEPQFRDIANVVKKLSQDFQGDPNLFTSNLKTSVGGPIDPIELGEVYLFFSEEKNERGVPCYLGLLWINDIYYGIEPNRTQLSGINFMIITQIEM